MHRVLYANQSGFNVTDEYDLLKASGLKEVCALAR